MKDKVSDNNVEREIFDVKNADLYFVKLREIK